jgi:hypothetical protein
MIKNGEDGSCEHNMGSHSKDNEARCELTYYSGDVSDCEPILHLFLMPDPDGIYSNRLALSGTLSTASLVLCLNDSLQSADRSLQQVTGVSP